MGTGVELVPGGIQAESQVLELTVLVIMAAFGAMQGHAWRTLAGTL